MRILLTGASGFVGRVLLDRILRQGEFDLVAVLRRRVSSFPDGVRSIQIPNIDGNTDWHEALSGIDTLVHLAARTHIMNETAHDPLAEFRKVNTDATLNLAEQAVVAGVRRLVFISSIGVNGAETFGIPFTADDVAAPHSPYAKSKYEAELGLSKLAEQTSLEVVIIRPPLVYGPAAPGNFGALVRFLLRGMPLPLGGVANKRSLVALDNLVDLIVTCLDHPKAANQTFLVSDGEDLSTTDLLRRMGQALGRPARLFPVPIWMLKTAAAMVGQRSLSQRLCGSLQVDIRKTCELLGWTPPVSVDEGLAMTAQYFLDHQRK